MDRDLLRQALTKFFAGLALTALLVFVPAGTLRYPGGLLLMAVLFVPMFVAGLMMMKRAPELLRRRLNAKEKQGEQKEVVWGSSLMFIAAFVLAGLNFRFGWLRLPDWAVWTASVLFLLAYLMWGEVLRENAWLSRTVEVQEGQCVVDHGLYGVVRHPMYSASVLLFLSMPLVLNSPLSFLVMLCYLPLIAKRIRNEEKLLQKELPGYEEYAERVKYRLIPFIW